MKTLHLYLILLNAFLVYDSGAQTPSRVNGRIIDKNKKPLEYVNVMLLKSADSSLVKGSISNNNGEFEIDNIIAGNYLVMLSQLGYEKLYTQPFELVAGASQNLNDLNLKDNVTVLKGVDVVAKKSFIERHTDKTVVNVENSIVDAGSTALEVLQKSPGVTVDNNDNISLKGKSGVLILIDGKPTYLANDDLAVMLKSMASDQVNRIEIMTTPPARYEASGNAGVINIVLRKDKRMGANGSIRGSFGQGKRPDAGGGINLNYRQNKTNVFGNYDYDWRKSVEDLFIKRNFRQNGIISSVFTSNSDIEFIGKTHRYKIGVDYDINDKNTFGVIFNGMNSENSHYGANTTRISNGENVVQSDAITVNNSNGEWYDYFANVNWLHKFDTVGTRLTVDLDYSNFHANRLQRFNSSAKDYNTSTILDEELKNDNRSEVEIKSVKADFEHPFSEKTKIEAGIKSSFVITDNIVDYYNIIDQMEVPDTTKSNHFKYTENINAGYVSLNTKFKKLGIQIGLRAEQTLATGEQITIDSTFKRDYLKLFPTVYLEHGLGKDHQLNFSFSRRYNRPSYQDLNPFRYYVDKYTYHQGNSLLEPQYSYNFELTETYKSMYSITFNYSITNDVITQITRQVDSTFTTYLTRENLNTLENYGVSLSVPIQVAKWWNSNNYFNVYMNHYEGFFEGGKLDKKSTSLSMHTNQSFLLPAGFSLELTGWYQSEHYYGIIKVEPMWSISTGIEKKFLSERASVKVLVNDIFYKSSFRGTTNYLNQDFEINSADDTRFVRIFASYRFGKKTVQQARRRSTGAEEERRRINKD